MATEDWDMSSPEALARIGTAIFNTLISPNESDRNGENANVVDGLFAIARSIDHLAKALEAPALEDPPERWP